jgi:hypothetical protein
MVKLRVYATDEKQGLGKIKKNSMGYNFNLKTNIAIKF